MTKKATLATTTQNNNWEEKDKTHPKNNKKKLKRDRFLNSFQNKHILVCFIFQITIRSKHKDIHPV